MNAMIYNEYYKSPLGMIEFKASERGITQLIFCGDQIKKIQPNDITRECQKQLEAYFAGNLSKFKLPLDWNGTPFQQSVWQILVEIPFGQTISYKDIAEKLNNPKAVRAVGGANSRNPITLIVPCHRVIGINATLTGYAGGVARKRWLLEHEGIFVKPSSSKQNLSDMIHLRQDKTQFLL